MGENRQRYLERLKERLERRQKRIEEGLDPDEEDEETMRLLEEEQAASTGNILQDLQNRFDEEKDALLRRLQVEFGLHRSITPHARRKPLVPRVVYVNVLRILDT